MSSVSPSKDERYLIEGPLSVGLWRFAIPFAAAFLLQALYGAVDLFVVGKYCDAAAVSAVSIGAQLMQSLTGVLIGFSVGAIVLIGFEVGAKNDRGVAEAIGSASTLFGIVALVLTPLVALGTNFCVELMQTPADAVGYARQYVFVCACGIPFIVGYNVVGAIYRGLGDAKTPTIFVLVACVVNIVADFVFVGAFGLGPQGAALATVLAQALGFGYALVHMRRRRFSFEFHRTAFWLRKAPVVKIAKVGAPLALQDALVNVSFLAILAIVNQMGVAQSAGLGVVERIVGFLMTPPVALSSAVATATAQNLGARLPRRAFRALALGTLFSFGFGATFWTVSQLFPTSIVGIFTDDAEITRQGALYLRSFALDFVMVAFVFNFNGYFCGCGRTVIALVHGTLATVGGRIPFSYLFSRLPNATLYNVGFAAPLASLISVVICVGYFVWLRRRERVAAPKPRAAAPVEIRPET